MSTKETPVFKTTVDGNEVELILRKPNVKDTREAQVVFLSSFAKYTRAGALLRIRLDDFAREQGVWNDEKEARFTALRQELLDAERKLDMGGIKLQDAKNIAIGMIKNRSELKGLIADRTLLDNYTAEGQADNDKFNYLVAACLVYKDSGKPFFADVADYLNHGSDPAALWGAQQMSYQMYQLDGDLEQKLPEFRFLRDFKFVDDKLRFINEDGHLVDADGRLVDENGRFVNAKGEFVDREGNKVDVDGNFVTERKPFITDDNQEVAVPEKRKKK